MSETTATRRKRLLHRSRYRGFREADLVFGRFAERHLDGMDDALLDQYERLLDESDQDSYAWVTSQRPVPARHDNEVMRMLRRLDYARDDATSS